MSKQTTLRVSEIFYSIEGEGPYTGHPMIFVRLFGCNFTCSGFDNPERTVIEFEKTDSLKKVKIGKGCDSAYSWHPDFKHLAKDYTVEELTDAIINLYPAVKGSKLPILCFTGGEPMLWQTQIAEVLHRLSEMDDNQEIEQSPETVLIETNGSLSVKPELAKSFAGYYVVWANSPKLSISGEPWERAINRAAIVSQKSKSAYSGMQYFKFVSDGSNESFDEIEKALQHYAGGSMLEYERLLDKTWVMPMGSTTEQQQSCQRRVAEQCLVRSLKFCMRVHCFVFNNETGT